MRLELRGTSCMMAAEQQVDRGRAAAAGAGDDGLAQFFARTWALKLAATQHEQQAHRRPATLWAIILHPERAGF